MNHKLICQVSKLARVEILPSDIKSMNTCAFTIHFQDISVFSKVLVEWKQIVFANTCLLVNNTKMNSVDTLNEYYCYEK